MPCHTIRKTFQLIKKIHDSWKRKYMKKNEYRWIYKKLVWSKTVDVQWIENAWFKEWVGMRIKNDMLNYCFCMNKINSNKFYCL